MFIDFEKAVDNDPRSKILHTRQLAIDEKGNIEGIAYAHRGKNKNWGIINAKNKHKQRATTNIYTIIPPVC